MGNEMGHPEWIDFPREGNNNSFHHCRRQWNLLRDEGSRHGQLFAFDQAMNALEVRYGSMTHDHQYVSLMHEDDKLIVYEKGNLVYAFNFHWEKSYEHYQVGTHWGSDHFIVLETDMEEFAGFQRLNGAHKKWVEVQKDVPWHDRRHSLKLYVPARTAVVLCPYEFAVGKDEPMMPEVTDRQRAQV